jgi:S1-C subfamily serine protease
VRKADPRPQPKPVTGAPVQATPKSASVPVAAHAQLAHTPPAIIAATVPLTAPAFRSATPAVPPARNAAGLAEAALSPTEILIKAKPSVVMIIGKNSEGSTTIQGSGFIVAQDRIVTNHHVAEDMAIADVVFSDGTSSKVSGVVCDSDAEDLVVLEAKTNNLAASPLGDESTLQQGDAVFAIGAPKGLELTLTNGIVSAFRNMGSRFLIQSTAAIWHGSSGGPLFSDQGKVVGITSAFFADAPGIYLSVSVGDLKRLLRTPETRIASLSEWSRQLSTAKPNQSQSGQVSEEGWETGKLTSWKAAKNEERTFFISSNEYTYGVTHALGLRAVYWAAAIGARNPLSNLPLGSEIHFRVEGRYMYIVVKKKETMYSIDTATPRR